MNKILKILASSSFALLLFGCTQTTNLVDYANISDETSLLSGTSYSLTNKDYYEAIREANNITLINNLIEEVTLDKIDFTIQANLDWYHNELNYLAKTKFVDSNSYNYNGEFSEEKLISYLNTQLFSVSCLTSDSILDNEYFSCDYSDYIERSLKYEAYQNMLTEKYIAENKASAFNAYSFRDISYLEIKKDTEDGLFVTLEFMQNALNDIALGTTTFEDIASQIKADKIAALDTEYEGITTPESGYYTLMESYTDCGDYICSPSEGLDYKKQEVQDTKYVYSAIVEDSNDELFNSAILERLFSSNVADKLVTINSETYLTSTADAAKTVFNTEDALIYNADNLMFYLIKVNVINSDSDFYDKVNALKEVISDLSFDDAFKYYLSDANVTIHEQYLLDNLVTNYDFNAD